MPTECISFSLLANTYTNKDPLLFCHTFLSPITLGRYLAFTLFARTLTLAP